MGEEGLIQILRGMEGEAKPYEILAKPEMLPIIEAALDPSPEGLAETVDSDLKAFCKKLYSRTELTDMLWLNTFRIVSSRMGRDGHLIVTILYVPLDNIPQVEEIHKGFKELTHNCGVRGEFGFLTPIDQGAHNSPLQTLINSYMDVYYPYFCDKRRFCNHRTRMVLEPLGFECPELTSAVFKRCMDFAGEAGWGSKIRV